MSIAPKEIAVFRRLQGVASQFITISKRMLYNIDSDIITMTIANAEDMSKYVHIAKRMPKAKIHGSVKINIPKEVLEQVSLKNKDYAWIRIMPYTESPPPPAPYILRPFKVHSDKSTLFFLLSFNTVDLLKKASKKQTCNLYIKVYLPDAVIDYIKKPAKLRRDRLYKIVLPSPLFRDLVHSHDTIIARIECTEKPEEYFYTF